MNIAEFSLVSSQKDEANDNNYDLIKNKSYERRKRNILNNKK